VENNKQNDSSGMSCRQFGLLSARCSVTFSAEISRTSPTAILFVIDESTSMRDRLETTRSKAEFLTDVLNKTIYTLITTCSKSGGLRDYFHVGVVAYSGLDARNGFQGNLSSGLLPSIRPTSFTR
jgi:hypothetical protein